MLKDPVQAPGPHLQEESIASGEELLQVSLGLSFYHSLPSLFLALSIQQ